MNKYLEKIAELNKEAGLLSKGKSLLHSGASMANTLESNVRGTFLRPKLGSSGEKYTKFLDRTAKMHKDKAKELWSKK